MAFQIMYFVLGDRAGKEEFTSRGLEPNTNSTRRAGLLAAIAGPMGFILGQREARNEAEAAAAAAAASATGTAGTAGGTPAATEFVVPDVTRRTLDAAVRTLAADPGKFSATEIVVSDPNGTDPDKPPHVAKQYPPAGESLPQGGEVQLRVHVKPASDPIATTAEVASTLRKIADELATGKL